MAQANTPVTIRNAACYAANGVGEMAYQIEYSDGTQVRAVFTRDGWARKEYKNDAGQWVAAGKPYTVRADRKRQAERMRDGVIAWLARK